MDKIFPQKLVEGDEVRIIAPSRSLAIISEFGKQLANNRFAAMGLKLTFGQHVDEKDDFASSSLESRVADFHQAFSDKNVKAVITVIGGFNCNQLLDYLDWELIKANPKIFCGFSDITVLNNSIFAKTGLVTYSGPHYSTFGQELHFDYTWNYFKKCLFSEEPIILQPSSQWSDDFWFKDQKDRNLLANDGYLLINEGTASGTIIGANLCTFNLLQGTQYFPDLTDSVLLIEDDEESAPHTFDRDLQSLIHQSGFVGVKGILIGRFQKVSKFTNDLLMKIIKTKKELAKLPVVANIDFGHTDPKITFPIGGQVNLLAQKNNIKIEILKH